MQGQDVLDSIIDELRAVDDEQLAAIEKHIEENPSTGNKEQDRRNAIRFLQGTAEPEAGEGHELGQSHRSESVIELATNPEVPAIDANAYPECVRTGIPDDYGEAICVAVYAIKFLVEKGQCKVKSSAKENAMAGVQ